MLKAHGAQSQPPASIFGDVGSERSVPEAGDVAVVRQRQYVVERVGSPGKFVFVNLQKRLLSSVAAFYRTLQAHVDRPRKNFGPQVLKDATGDDADAPEERGAMPELTAELAFGAADMDAEARDTDEDELDRRTDAQKLTQRGQQEARALRSIILAQRERIFKAQQLRFNVDDPSADELAQLESERRHMNDRLKAIDDELEREPRELEALYDVVLERLEPVRMVYLWPTTRS